jgi:iron complex transport system substrate-binding protein
MAAGTRSLITALLLAVAAAIPLAGCEATPPAGPRTAQRIVSLVPTVTEMLFVVGAGPQVVGVSSYDHFPADVERLPKVGALIDPDNERILALRPDLVIVYGSQSDSEARFKTAGILTFSYRHDTAAAIAGTLDMIVAIGTLTGHEARAREVVTTMKRDLDAVRARVAGRATPRTLLVMARQPGTLRGLYVSGGVGFLHEMLEIAGGRNVFADAKRESVQPSSETLLARAPEAVLELYGYGDPAARGTDIDVWKSLASIPAVRESRVQVLSGDHVVVAGPRLAQGAEAMARALHPDAYR